MPLPEPEYNAEPFKALDLSSQELRGKTFTACTFEKCSFREAALLRCKFQDCKFIGCDLSLVALRECSFKSTLFENSQLIGVSWMDTNLTQSKPALAKPVDFIGCVLNHSTFMGATLKNAKLTKCVAREVSFEEANLTRADCTATDFRAAASCAPT